MARISTEKKAEIVRMYLENTDIHYDDIAKHFGVSTDFVRRTVKAEVEAGNGIKPDRRKRKTLPSVELDEAELDEKHREALKAQHPRTSDWMEHVKPLNARKRELEENVQHKQAELNAARQELRDFTATLRQLMKEE
jgi:transposase-like protein